MPARSPDAAAGAVRPSFEVDRARTTTTATALHTAQQQPATLRKSSDGHKQRTQGSTSPGISEAFTRAASILLPPSRRKSTGPGAAAAATASGQPLSTQPYQYPLNGPAGKGPVLGRTATFRLRNPNPAANPSAQQRALDSYNARNVAAALDPNLQTRQTDDVWQQVAIRVLPLFNGEGIRGFIEELNELVLTHVQRTFLSCQSSRPAFAPPSAPSQNLSTLVTGLITADLTDLIRIGLVTLANKLAPLTPARPLSDEKLLARLNEIWLFFFTGVLPHLEGVFWVLRSDDRLRAAVGDSGAAATHGGGTRDRPHDFADSRIDVRRIALIEFRDCIIHPEIHRLADIFSAFYPSTNPLARGPRRDFDGGGGGGGGRAGGTDSQPSTRPPSISQPYSYSDASHPAPHHLAFPAPFHRSKSSPSPSASPSRPERPYPNERHRSSPSAPAARSPRVPEWSPTYDPRSPALRTASGTGEFRPPARPFATARGDSQTESGAGGSASGGGGLDESLARSPAEAQALARRRQMVAILASLLTADDRQAEMDELVRLLRPVYNARYRQRPRPSPPEATTEENGGRAEEDDDDDDEEDHLREMRGEAAPRDGRRLGFETPPPMPTARSSPEAIEARSPHLTTSPIALGRELRAEPTETLPAPVPLPGPKREPYPAATAGMTRQISARQRSRTMNSLDEESIEGLAALSLARDQHSHPHPHGRIETSPDRTRKVSSASGPPAITPAAATAPTAAPPAAAAKKTRRLSFRPWLMRSNSAASTSGTSVEGVPSSAAPSEEGAAGTGGGGPPTPSEASGAGSLTPGTVEGDRLRRELLRRNSSRRASDMSGVVPQLGVGYSQFAEDPIAADAVGLGYDDVGGAIASQRAASR